MNKKEDIYLTDIEPKVKTFCIGCHEELHAPFLVVSPYASWNEPPCDEYFCLKCAEKDKREIYEIGAQND